MTTGRSRGSASPSESPSEADRADIAALLGREPFTDLAVAVRCPHGGPAIVRSAPIDLRGRPFPTRDWLACRALGEAVSRLEAAGGVRRLEADPSMRGPLADAHARHMELHAGHRVAGSGDPEHVKCLHAHLAFGLAEGGTPVSDWIVEAAGAHWPGVCCLERLRGGGDG